MTDDDRREALHALEAEFTTLIGQFRRRIAENANRVSPGLLPAVYKVFTTIARRGETTLSALSECLHADKGQVSRAVRELEGLGLVVSVPDPTDGRARLLSATTEGHARLAGAQTPQEESMMVALSAWEIDDIRQLTTLLHALSTGDAPR